MYNPLVDKGVWYSLGMKDWIRDNLPSVQSFLLFYFGAFFGMVAAHLDWGVAIATLVGGLILYLYLAISTDRAQSHEAYQANREVPDIDLTW